MSYGHFHSAGSLSANSWSRIHSYVVDPIAIAPTSAMKSVVQRPVLLALAREQPVQGVVGIGDEAIEGRRGVVLSEDHREQRCYASRMSTSRGGTGSRTERIVSRVRAIPAGFVRTYGDIDPRAPRLVGLVLATTHEGLPWHRVVRADGTIPKGTKQRELLLKEGVPMRGDRVDLREARLPSEI